MSIESQAALAERLRAMHHAPLAPLILPNAWDAASARIIEQAGFPAIATTSAGVAWSLGYPDGERMSRATMLEAVARIARSVRVPVTADLEAGYGPRPEDAAATAAGAIEAGAVGFNFEDATDDAAHPLRARGGRRGPRAARDQRAHGCVPGADRRAGHTLRGDGAAPVRLPRRGRGLSLRAGAFGCTDHWCAGAGAARAGEHSRGPAVAARAPARRARRGAHQSGRRRHARGARLHPPHRDRTARAVELCRDRGHEHHAWGYAEANGDHWDQSPLKY